ncbi:MAG: polyprenol monophosphomannose synthase [Candidatus Limnocylindrus sp.]
MEAGEGVIIVIPTYQEADAILPLLAQLRVAIPKAYFLIVDDNSPDGTAQRVKAAARVDANLGLIVRQQKEGIGPAYCEGFLAALHRSPRVIMQMDADGSHDPTEAVRLYVPIIEGRADLVIGSRRVRGGSTMGWSRARNLLSKFGSSYVRFLLRLHARDATSGYRAWRPELLRAILGEALRADGYGFQIEMAWRAQQLGGIVIDAPITFRERVLGASKMRAGIALEAALLVLTLMRTSFPPKRS